MSLPWWDDDSLLWDIAIIGGEVVPATAVAVQVTVERAVDVQSVKGSDGATIADNGYTPAPVQIACNLTTDDGGSLWRDFQSWVRKVHPRTKGGLRQPQDIIHPAANLLGVNTIYIRKISAPVVSGGVATVAIEAIEWFPAPKKAKTSKKPKNNFDPADYDVPGPADDGSPDLLF